MAAASSKYTDGLLCHAAHELPNIKIQRTASNASLCNFRRYMAADLGVIRTDRAEAQNSYSLYDLAVCDVLQ